MKKYLLYFVPAFCLIAASCSSMLEEESYTEIGRDNYVNNATEAETVLLGVYKNMVSDYTYSYHLSLLFTISTDIAQCEGSSNTNFREIPTNSHNPATDEIANTWAKLYSAIYDANSFIETVSERIDGWGDTNRELGTIYLGEARALRALFYFELVRWYGNIVLIKSTAESKLPATEYVQADPAEVYAFIEEDLKYAAEVLPWAVDDTLRSSTAYRFSKGSALGLLAKVYCTWAGYPLRDESKWAEAAAVARRVVESGKHRLIPDYETVWYNTCNGIWDAGESLIEVSFY
ncbi:MAG: RagB/SusD family nutrient uptake outer membrane protein, partial [Alistipes sp.]|nr:RagB/SusD family nutrient uptake outer membrane protein [Alistipes sp.]